MMPIEVNLQPERAPGGDAHVAQPQVFVDEIEVVVQALAVVGAQIGLARLFVMPGLIAATRLHSRKDTDQARMRAALAQNLLTFSSLRKLLVRRMNSILRLFSTARRSAFSRS